MQDKFKEKIGLIVPGAYWFITRLDTIGEKIQYLATVILPQIVFLIIHKTNLLATVYVYIIALFGMIFVYEFGYMANDYWAQRREKTAGLFVRKPPPNKLNKTILITGIFTRVASLLIILSYIPIDHKEKYVYFSWLVLIFIIFMLHNFILGRMRILSFSVLYFTRLQLPVLLALFLYGRPWVELLAVWEVYSVLYSLSYSIAYGVKKRFFKCPVWLKEVGAIELALIPIAIILLFVAALIFIVGMMLNYNLGVTVILILCLDGIVVSYLFLWGSMRFGRNAILALKKYKTEMTHTHSEFSHDSTMTKKHYEVLINRRPQLKIYITDHAEDLDKNTYTKLLKEYKSLYPKIVCGLEYSIEDQHILALGLLSYVDINCLNQAEALCLLKEQAETIIWAHPNVSLRRLIKYPYVKTLLTIMALVSGIEIYNKKNAYKLRNIITMVICSWIACTIYGRRLLYIGVDLHHPEEFSDNL